MKTRLPCHRASLRSRTRPLLQTADGWSLVRAVPGGGRRRTDAATHLTDHVLPAVPYRQWTFSLPKRLARDPKLLAQGLRRFPGTVFAWQRTKAKAEGISHPLTGSPSRLAKRFGGQLNLNVH